MLASDSQGSVIDEDEDNIFKILLATDIHLGHNEKDPIRGYDSFNTFEEILQIANAQEVDFVLLGGDLFDANKPSQHTLHKAVQLLRKYTFGENDIKFQILHDFEDADLENTTAKDLKEAIPDLNYLDPNLNISLPIFSIHGNHDDPTGRHSISSLNTMSAMGLVNYFGRCDKLETLQIRPIIFCKGSSRLCIYGAGHLADKRFARLQRKEKVFYHKVNEETAFQMFVLHQNRANRGSLNYLPDTSIPSFFDLVMWGHEHDCQIEPQVFNDVYYTQPGSSVATSLSQGESMSKKVGVLYVKGKKFHIKPIPLKTVRPFVFRQLTLDPVLNKTLEDAEEDLLSEDAERLAMKEIMEMVEEAKKQNVDGDDENTMLPLIRLQIFYFDERQVFSHRKFVSKYEDRVANLRDMIVEKKITLRQDPGSNADGDEEECTAETIERTERPDDYMNQDMLSYVREELEKTGKHLEMYNLQGVYDTLIKCINTGDSHSISDYHKRRLDEIESFYEDWGFTEEEVEAKLERYIQINNPNIVRIRIEDPVPAPDTAASGSRRTTRPKPTRAKPTRARGSTNSRGKKATKRTYMQTIDLDSDHSDDDPTTSNESRAPRAASVRARGRGRKWLHADSGMAEIRTYFQPRLVEES